MLVEHRLCTVFFAMFGCICELEAAALQIYLQILVYIYQTLKLGIKPFI